MLFLQKKTFIKEYSASSSIKNSASTSHTTSSKVNQSNRPSSTTPIRTLHRIYVSCHKPSSISFKSVISLHLKSFFSSTYHSTPIVFHKPFFFYPCWIWFSIIKKTNKVQPLTLNSNIPHLIIIFNTFKHQKYQQIRPYPKVKKIGLP